VRRVTYDTELDADQSEALATALEEAEWHTPAADIRDGVSPEVVLSRLRALSWQEDCDTGDAAQIIAEHIEKVRRAEAPRSRP
jgi:hypothetical protein